MPAHPPEPETGRAAWSPRETLEQATLAVQTQALEKKGIRKLRVVSESRFLEILENLLRPPASPAERSGSERPDLEDTVIIPRSILQEASGQPPRTKASGTGVATPRPVAAPEPAGDAADRTERSEARLSYDDRWRWLRAECLERVLRVEKLMARMSGAFQRFQTTLERLGADRPGLRLPTSGAQETELRRQALLERMLLGEAPRNPDRRDKER